jgi:hypothetical protein
LRAGLRRIQNTSDKRDWHDRKSALLPETGFLRDPALHDCTV